MVEIFRWRANSFPSSAFFHIQGLMSKISRFILLFLVPFFVFGQERSQTSSTPSSTDLYPFLMQIFADSLADAYTLEEDPMGAQVVTGKFSALTQSVTGSTSFNYTSNPFKQPKSAKTHSKSTSLDLSLTFNLGLKENMELVMKWYVSCTQFYSNEIIHGSNRRLWD